MRHAAGPVETFGVAGELRGSAAVPPTTAPEADQFGTLFRDLRRALGVSLAELSARLQTPIDVIAALEASDVRRLPPWPETARVVAAYTGLAAIDAAPVLGVIRRALDAAGPVRETGRAVVTLPPRAGVAARAEAQKAQAKPAASVRKAPESARAPLIKRFTATFAGLKFSGSLARLNVSGPLAGLNARLGRMPAAARRTGAIAMILVALAAVSGSANSLNASFATLHPPIKRLVRSAQDYLLWRAAPVHEGMRWIHVDDPRSRKGDRLKARHS